MSPMNKTYYFLCSPQVNPVHGDPVRCVTFCLNSATQALSLDQEYFLIFNLFVLDSIFYPLSIRDYFFIHRDSLIKCSVQWGWTGWLPSLLCSLFLFQNMSFRLSDMTQMSVLIPSKFIFLKKSNPSSINVNMSELISS